MAAVLNTDGMDELIPLEPRAPRREPRMEPPAPEPAKPRRKWQEVQADPRFQALSSDDQEAARAQYFDEVVAPQVDETDVSLARKQFDQETRPGRVRQAAHDAGRVVGGAAMAAKGILDRAADAAGPTIDAGLQAIQPPPVRQLSPETTPGVLASRDRPPRVERVASQALPTEARALLNTIAGTESPGYDVLYGGRRFQGFADHPRKNISIGSGPNVGKTSSAAGRYQFLAGTWDDQARKLGLRDFSPENQDLAAWNLASETYRAKTSRDLLSDLRSGDPDVRARVGQTLAGVWTSLPGGIETQGGVNRFGAAYEQALAKESNRAWTPEQARTLPQELYGLPLQKGYIDTIRAKWDAAGPGERARMLTSDSEAEARVARFLRDGYAQADRFNDPVLSLLDGRREKREDAYRFSGADPESARRWADTDLKLGIDRRKDEALSRSMRPGYFDMLADEFKRGLINLGANAGDQAAFAMDVAGADQAAKGLLESMKLMKSEAEALAGPVQDFAQINTEQPKYLLDDATRYVGSMILSNLPMMLPSIGTGVLGGVVAQKAAQTAAKALVESVGPEAAAKYVMAKVAQGAAIGAGASAVGLETGSIYGDIYGETGQMRPGVAAAGGVLAGALDAIPAWRAATKLIGAAAASQVAGTVLKRLGREAGIQFLAEGGTEFVQTLIERGAVHVVDGTPLVNEADVHEAINAAVAGGLTGGAMGGLSQGAAELRRPPSKAGALASELQAAIDKAKLPMADANTGEMITDGQAATRRMDPFSQGQPWEAPKTPAQEPWESQARRMAAGGVKSAAERDRPASTRIAFGDQPMDGQAAGTAWPSPMDARVAGAEWPEPKRGVNDGGNQDESAGADVPGTVARAPAVEGTDTGTGGGAGFARRGVTGERADGDAGAGPDTAGQGAGVVESGGALDQKSAWVDEIVQGSTRTNDASIQAKAREIRQREGLSLEQTVSLYQAAVNKHQALWDAEVARKQASLTPEQKTRRAGALLSAALKDAVETHRTVPNLYGDEEGLSSIEDAIDQLEYVQTLHQKRPITTRAALLKLLPFRFLDTSSFGEVGGALENGYLDQALGAAIENLERTAAKAEGKAPEAKSPAPKEPWAMTREEYKAKNQADQEAIHKRKPKPLRGAKRGDFEAVNQYDKAYREWREEYQKAVKAEDAHEHLIQEALAAGKPVPPEVLADYPELAGKAKPDTDSRDDTETDFGITEKEKAGQTVDGLPADFGANNTLFTKERADRAREILRKKLGQLNSGFDPEIAAAGLELAGYYIEGGARDFAAYTQAMVKGLGEAVRPYLRSFYESARHYPGLDTVGMSSAEEIERALRAKPDDSAIRGREVWEGLSAVQRQAYLDKNAIQSITEDTPWGKIVEQIKGRIVTDVRDGRLTAEAATEESPAPSRYEKDWAEIAQQMGGKVVFRQGDIALILGYSLLGNPVFAGVKGSTYTRADIASYTGDLFTQAETAALTRAKDQWVRADAAAHEANPDGPFAGGVAVAFSDSVPEAVRGVMAAWRKQLGIPARIFVAVNGDARGLDLHGPFAAVPSQAIEPNEPGSKRQLSNGDFSIVYNPQARLSETLEVLAHELGHVLMDTVYRDSPDAIKLAIRKEFDAWLKGSQGRPAGEHVRSMRPRGTGRRTAASVQGGQMADDLTPYWRSFNEWFADQVSRWATTQEKPLTAVQKFFARLGQKLKAFFARNRQYWPTATMREWLDGLSPTVVDQATAEASATPNDIVDGNKMVDSPLAPRPSSQEGEGGTVDAEPQTLDGAGKVDDTQAQETPKKRRVSKQKQTEAQDVDRETSRADGGAGVEGTGAGVVAVVDRPGDTGGVSGGEGGGDVRAATGSGEPGILQDSPVESGTAGTAAAGNRGHTAGVGASVANVPDVPRGDDYRIPVGGLTREGSWLDTARRNVEIVELVNRLTQEGRPATADEQALLVKFTGWGAADIRNQLFPSNANTFHRYNPAVLRGGWRELGERVAAVFTKEDWKTALRSTQYAHYTSEAVVRAAWQGVERLGFAGGVILEPGAGIGHFAGLMPDGIYRESKYLGIEMDGFTAKIAQLLYPGQTIRHADYVRSKVPKMFDLAIGNPPFASTAILDDPEYARQKFPLHDYFFAKSLDRVRPGGLLVFVTSRFSLDKKGDRARRYLAERADLLGAIRLPNTAFKANAGTQVVTDILFLRRREPGQAPAGESWLGLETMQSIEGEAVPVNEYFARHPEMILGQVTTRGDTLNPGEAFTVNPAGELEPALSEAIQRLPANVYSVAGPDVAAGTTQRTVIEKDWNPKYRKEGGLYLSDAGDLMRVESGAGAPLSSLMRLTAKEQAWLTDYVGVRDALKQAQYDQLSDGDWEASLKALKKVYAAFVKQHGPMLAFTQTETTKLNKEGEEETVISRRFKNDRLLRADIDGKALMTALEVIREDGSIAPGAVLQGRVLKRPAEPKIESVDDALAVSLAQTGRFDLGHVARLAGLEPKAALDRLGDLVFETPEGGHVLAEEYLSGDVRTKLDEAEAAAALHPRFARNVEALARVQPPVLASADVTVGMGATWVPLEFYQQYAQEVVGLDKPSLKYNPVSNEFEVSSTDRPKLSRRESEEWGTAYRSPVEVFDAAMNHRTVKVYVGSGTTNDPKRLDPEETKKVELLVRRMEENFSSWVWTDSQRTARVLDIYNDKFNRLAPRFFNGDHLNPPGLSLRYDLHKHQKRAIWRAIVTGNTYFAHAVGAGKTLEMIIAGMEQKRLGLINKPMYVVPNHMLEQFASEFMDAYPAANIMVADEKNFAADNRRRFIAQAALNNPDAIIITHSAFTILEMKPENMQAAFDDVIDDLRATLEELPDDFENRKTRGKIEAQLEKIERAMSGSSTERFTQRKKLQDLQTAMEEMRKKLVDYQALPGVTKAKLAEAKETIAKQEALIQAQAAKARTEELNAERDRSVLFEDMGVDFLFVDEAHEFRKLDYSTKMNIKGISPEGSVMALKLFVKTRWLEKQRPGRSFAFASGTPITNTLAELFTIQRFFQERQLRALGLIHFDAWAANFARVKTEYERNATGAWEAVDRLSKFVNVADLMAMVKQQMDVLTSSELAHLVKLPSVIQGNAGKRDILVTPRVPELDEYMSGELARRLKASREWKPSKDEPNNPDPVVAIITDGRVSALDMRYIDPRLPNNPDSKLNRLADVIIQQYRETADLTYIDPETKKVEPVKGGTQIVFASLGFGPGIAQSRGFDGRAWLNKRLRAAGIPASEVAWIWDYPTAAAKQAMFKEMRQGKKRILIGSPKNMGTGVNVQKRLTHKIDVDAPWYPSDMEQPDGRILRQGNQNEWVKLVGLATDGTYDSTMYSMVARKSGFIEQAFRGDRSLRVMDDISESSQYAMAAAIASGDPRYVQMAELESAVAKLEGAKELHERRQASLRADIGRFKGNAPILQKAVESARKVQEALEGVIFYSGYFDAVIAGQSMPKVKTTDLGEAVVAVVDREYEKAMGVVQRKALEDNRLGSSEHGGPTHTHKFQAVIGTLAGKAELVLSGKVGAFRPKNKAGQLEKSVSFTYESGAEVHVRVAGTVDSRSVDHWQANPPANRAMAAGGAITDRLNDLQKRALERRREALDENQEALEKAERAYGAPFPEQAKLVQAVTELAQLRRELAGEGKEVPEAAVKASVLPDFSLVRAAPKGGDRQAAFLAEAYGWPGVEGDREEAVRFSRRVLPETLTVDGVERPTRNSEGRPIHSTEEGVRNFWRWFAGSRVVDGQGRPVVVYRGRPDDSGSGVIRQNNDGFIFTSPNTVFANTYAGAAWDEKSRLTSYRAGQSPYVAPLYVRAKNLFDISRPDDYAAYKARFGKARADAAMDEVDGWLEMEDKTVRDWFIQSGYDGLRIKENFVDNITVFDSVQLKSATGNTGAFSPENKDIRYARKGAGTEGYTPASVRAAIDASEGKGFAAALERTGWFHVITGDQVPAEVRAQAGGDRIPAYTWQGQVYFVADEIHAGDSIPGLLRHEVAVHAMQLGRSDAEFRAILQAMRRLPGEKAARARAAVPKQTPGHLRDEEALAYFIEQNPTHSLARRFLAWLRGAIRALARRLPGVERGRWLRWAHDLSEDELIAMANSALRSAGRGDGALTGEELAKFSGRDGRGWPEFKTDVPSESWLAEQVDRAKQRGRDKFGVPYMGKTTGYYRGDVTVSLDILSALKGENGEQNKVRKADLEWLINELRSHGLKNVGAPYVEVGYDGVPWVSEGNHRIMAAQALGWKSMPVEVRYFDGGERVQGVFHPKTLRDEVKFSFGGEKAATADNFALESARARLEAGEDAEQVRQETGWFQGKDGKWRFEIDDSGARLVYANAPSLGEMHQTASRNAMADRDDTAVTLGDLISHEPLFAAYPRLSELQVIIENDVKFNARLVTGFEPYIILNNDLPVGRVLSTLLHEIQHGIQNIEGFATGGSVERFMDQDAEFVRLLKTKQNLAQRYRDAKESGRDPYGTDASVDELKTQAEEAIAQYDEFLRMHKLTAGLDPYEAYRRLYGEAEARNVQARQGFSDAQRRATPVSATQDVPDSDVIVTFNGKDMASAPRPANAGLPETMTVDGVERPTRNSEGRVIHPTEEGVRNFWRWFGDSKVVDGQGRPLVVYHGTKNDFSVFEQKTGTVATIFGSEPVNRHGFFFTANKSFAGVFSDGREPMALYIKAKNPLDMFEGINGDDADKLSAAGFNDNLFYSRIDQWELFDEETGADFTKSLRSSGFDGVWIAEPDDDGKTVRVFVALDKSQIKSATGNTGAFSPTNPDIRFSRRPSEPKTTPADAKAAAVQAFAEKELQQIDAAVAGAGGWGAALRRLDGRGEDSFRKLGAKARREILGALTVHQLVDVGGSVLPRMREYLTEMSAMDATRNRLIHDSDALAKRWGGLPKKEIARVGYVMHETTIAGFDPSTIPDEEDFEVGYKPSLNLDEAKDKIQALYRLQRSSPRDKRITEWQEQVRDLQKQMAFEKKRRGSASRLLGLYRALSPEGRAIYVEVRNYHSDHLDRIEAALEDMIEKTKMTGKQKYEAIQKLKQEFELLRVYPPYFPLGRFGDYWVNVAAEIDPATGDVIEDKERIFETFETREDADAFFEKYRSEGRQVSRGKKLENIREITGVSAGFVAEVEDMITEFGGGSPEFQDLRDQVYQLYLKTLPELSSRKHAIHRASVEGYAKDALRVFANKAFHDAYQYARIKHGFELREIMEQLQADVAAAGSAAKVAEMAARRALLEGFRDEVLSKKMPFRAVKERAMNLDVQAAEILAKAKKRRLTEGEQFVIDEAARWNQYSAWFGEWHKKRKPKAMEIKRMTEAQLERELSALDLREQTIAAIQAHPTGHEFAPDLLNELQKAYQWLMNPTTGRVASMLNALGFGFHLAVSPAAWVTNATQTPLIAMPYVAATRGLVKTHKAFKTALGEAMRSSWRWNPHKEHRFGIREALIKQDEIDAYNQALDRGLVDRGRVMDLIGLAEEGADRLGGWQRFGTLMALGFHEAERVNREVTFMAAYRLARDAGESFMAAVGYADTVVNETHFNYTAENRARWMRSDAARVLLQFKSYAQHVTYLQWKMVRAALGQAPTPEAKAAARKFLMVQTAVQLAAGGVMGLPLGVWATMGAVAPGLAAAKRWGYKGALLYTFALMGAAVGLGGDDPDDPVDWWAEFEQAMADAFGATGGQAVGRGLVNAVGGIDLSSRVSMRELWWREIGKDIEERSFVSDVLTQAAGPSIGVLVDIGEGMTLAAQGQTYRGIERMVPKMIRDGMQAVRFFDEGALTLKGDPLIEELTPLEILSKGMGWTPSRLTARYAENQAEMNRKERIEARKQRLTRDIAEAGLARRKAEAAGEEEQAAEAEDRLTAALERAKRYNQKQPQYPITPDSLSRSVKGRLRARLLAKDGVFMNKRIPERYEFAPKE